MTNRYIIHGATFNGDGTTSAEATVNGGVGAWNTIAYFEGTTPAYGTLAAGDVVYIRSKDAAGADITVTMTVGKTFGSAVGSAGSWVTWILDNGVVWSGVDGTLTYTHASTHSVTLRSFNNYVSAGLNKLTLAVTGTGSASSWLITPSSGACVCSGILFDASGQTGAGNAGTSLGASHAVFENCTFKYNVVSLNGWYSNIAPILIEFINPTFVINANSTRLFFFNDEASAVLIGGSISGAGSLLGMSVANTGTSAYLSSLKMVGTKYPPEMPIMPLAPGAIHLLSEFSGLWGDGSFGSEVNTIGGVINSRDDGNFPKLNATFPSGALWSWKCYARGASLTNPLTLSVSKLYVDASASKTIAFNLLIANSYVSALNDALVWVVGSYIDDSTGLSVGFSTKGVGSALAASGSAWSADFYGAIPCSSGKKKLAVTTGTAIKQNTQITARLFVAKAPASVSDIFFFDPDIVLT